MKKTAIVLLFFVLTGFVRFNHAQDCTDVLKYARMSNLFETHLLDYQFRHSDKAKEFAFGMEGTLPGAVLAAIVADVPIPLPVGDAKSAIRADYQAACRDRFEQMTQWDQKWQIDDLSVQPSKIYETCMQPSRSGLHYAVAFPDPDETDIFDVSASFGSPPITMGKAWSELTVPLLTASMTIENGSKCKKKRGRQCAAARNS